MLGRPRLRHGLTAISIPGEGTILLSEKKSRLLTDHRLEHLLPLLDGLRSLEEIQAAVAPALSAIESALLIAQLASKGYVYDAPDDTAIDPAYWSAAGIHPMQALARLREWNVEIRDLGPNGAPTREAFLGDYADVCQGPRPFSVVFTDDHLRPELADFNLRALAEERPWMLVKAVGQELWYGPIFLPSVTGCWECLAQRLRLNRQVETFLRERSCDPLNLRRDAPEKLSILGLELARNALLKWLGTGKSDALGAVLTYDVLQCRQQRHVLARRPQCPACGDADLYARSLEQPVVFQSRPKKTQPFAAEKSFTRLEHHISPITGIVHEIFPLRLPELPFIQVQLASHAQCTSYENLDWLKESLRVFSSGKGTREAEARMSALAESIEVHLTSRLGDEPIISATRDELGSLAIAPESIMLFSTRQQESGVFPGAWPDTDTVHPPVASTTPINWIPVWSLTENCRKYAPADCLFWDTDSAKAVAGYGSTDGSAATWHLETSFLHGFFELIERDASSIWWYHRLQRPALDLAAFADPFVQETLANHSNIGRQMWVLDLTHDFEIPVFVALSALREAPHGKPVFGFGCHLDASIALRKAVTELNQFMPQVCRVPETSATDKVGQTSQQITDRWFSQANLENCPWLVPSAEPPRGSSAFAALQTSDYVEDIEICLAKAKARNIEVLMLRRTRPDIELETVKLIAPGLRHFWPRFAPGRLYDVPVSLGWLPKATREEDLNPTPIFV